MSWLAIWDEGLDRAPRSAPPLDPDRPVAAMTFWLEAVAPRRIARPVRVWHGAAPADRALSIYLLPDGTLRVVHADLDVSTPTGFIAPGESFVLRHVACARGRSDVVDLRNLDSGARHRVRSAMARVPRLDEAIPRDPGFAAAARVAAIADHAVAGTDLPGLAQGTAVATPAGPVAVETLAPGMSVLGRDGRPRILRWTQSRDRLCLGRTAPVLLRAPYFGLPDDLWVTPETRVLRSGPEVEYQCGTDQVLVRAVDLVGDVAVSLDRSRPIRRFFHLLLDDPDCLSVGRCRVETALLSEVVASEDTGRIGARPARADRMPCLPLLDRPAAQALLGAVQRKRGSQA